MDRLLVFRPHPMPNLGRNSMRARRGAAAELFWSYMLRIYDRDAARQREKPIDLT